MVPSVLSPVFFDIYLGEGTKIR